jgi:MFS family permease
MTRKVPPVTAIALSFGIATLSWLVIAVHPNLWTIIAAMIVWSIGEMTQAPRYYEYIADHAPKGQEALFQGYAFLPIAIAWFIGGTFGGWLYSTFAGPVLVKNGSALRVIGEPTGIWLTLAAIGAVATLLMLSYNAFIAKEENGSATI